MKPIIMIYDHHVDPGSIDTLIELLPILAAKGYRNFCYESEFSLREQIRFLTDQIFAYDQGRVNARYYVPYSGGDNLRTMLSVCQNPDQVSGLTRRYVAERKRQLLNWVAENSNQINYHPFDIADSTYKLSEEECLAPEREQGMMEKLAPIIATDAGTIIYTGISHYKLQQLIKQRFPEVTFNSLFYSQFPLRLTNPYPDQFVMTMLNSWFPESQERAHVFQYGDCRVHVFNFTKENSQRALTLTQKVFLQAQKEALAGEIEVYLRQHSRDVVISQHITAGQYTKVLRNAANCGRAYLIKILLKYAKAIGFDVHEKASGRNALDYVRARNHLACVELLEGYR